MAKPIVIGASAGGVEALAQLVGDLPPDLPAVIGVVVHFPSHATSVPARYPQPGWAVACGSC
jgi:two-component system chemotaxis response regulator CheB